jgi:hypothetical protein
MDVVALARTRLVDLGELADAAPQYMTEGFPLQGELERAVEHVTKCVLSHARYTIRLANHACPARGDWWSG